MHGAIYNKLNKCLSQEIQFCIDECTSKHAQTYSLRYICLKWLCKINNMVIFNHLMKPTEEWTQKNIEILHINNLNKFFLKAI